MAIKICCTMEDGKKNYGNGVLSMEYDVQNEYIRKRGYITAISGKEGYILKNDLCGWRIAPIIFYCPYCGAKIEEEDDRLNAKADYLLGKCEMLAEEIKELKRQI